MEETDRYNGGDFGAGGGDEALRSSVFAELKPYCLELLELLQNPQKRSSSLPQLLRFLRKSPSASLQSFLDYTLFPLLLLLDAAVDCRSIKKVDSEEKLISGVPKKPHKVSDSVAEGVLQCLEELLKKCQLGSVDQMVVVLKKLTYGALLSASEASEEFREGVIKCFRALIFSLQPCSDMSCFCKQSLGFPILLASGDLQIPLVETANYDSEAECLIAFLLSQGASAAVGHWLSLLLKAADTEAQRGHRGSAKLRVEAFLSLRVLVAKVGSADALAFFLPGVVSQFSKVLYVSKTMISGAAGSVEAMDQAIRGLAEFLMVVLQDDANLSGLDNVIAGFHASKDGSTQSFLEELRQLPIKSQGKSETIAEDSSSEIISSISPKFGVEEKDSISSRNMLGSLHVTRTKDWIEKTSTHVDKLLCATFPKICVHPAKRVRQGLLSAIQGLLSKCSQTLKKSRLMLLECLCVLVCDDSEEVSAAAQSFLEYLFSSSDKHHIERDFAEIFSRLIENLPKVVLGSEESVALSHAQQLLVLIYFSGPRFVVDHLLQSPIKAARFLDVFAVCLSQNSVFSGSVDKLLLSRPSTTGYLRSVAELKSICFTSDDQATMSTAPYEISKFPGLKDKEIQYPLESMQNEYELPHMPPWFVYVGNQKLYKALAGILRLVGLSTMAEFGSEGYLSVISDIPLGYFRKLVSEVRMREYNKESWQSWYRRTGSGQLLRQASTAACMLNEMIFGISDQAVGDFTRMFQKSKIKQENIKGYDAGFSDDQHYRHEPPMVNESIWRASPGRDAKSYLSDCIGSIMHEYLSSEVWDLPTEQKSSLLQEDGEAENFSVHLLHDTAMLHQEIYCFFTDSVIIDGIGIFNICLGNDFASSGFLHTSLYLLLENLICPNFEIRRACDAILRVLATTSGYSTVGHLVLANADYVIDSICRQLRHLDLNPHVPNVLSAMLSYIGIAHKILPLLEEPMHSVSTELEILGRHQHPNLTIPFLKAVAEIAKASKKEACSMPVQTESYSIHVKSKMSDVERKARIDSGKSSISCHEEDMDAFLEESEDAEVYLNDADLHLDEWESILFKLNDSRRYRRTVGSIASSCLTAATPLVASVNQAACLVALDIVEDGIETLAKVEEAYRHEKEAKEAIERVIKICSFYHLKDNLDAAEEGADENRLLPAMNKIWPFLVVCIRNKNPVSVRRCLDVITKVIHICGGDFFSRRFHTDGAHFWRLLTTSPFQKKPISKDEKTPLLLPYRRAHTSPDDSTAEVSTLKVQAAMLNMIANVSQNKRTASVMEAVLKKVSGLVVGIACSRVSGLRDAALNALRGLASIDSDLIWLLLADVYYSLRKKNMPSPPTSDLPEISRVLPPPSSSPKDYLYVQYGGQSYGFDVDFSSVEIVFQKLHSDVFTSQMYI